MGETIPPKNYRPFYRLSKLASIADNPMPIKRITQTLTVLVMTGLVSVACKAQPLDELEDGSMPPVEFRADSKVKAIIMTGTGMENKYLGRAGQGMAVRDKIMYRLYDTGLCQTFDLSDLANPKKIASFELGSHGSINHANCAQTCLDENGDVLLYVSGQKEGKTYVERVTSTGSTLIQTITLSAMDLLDQTIILNAVCGDDGYLWYFGAGGSKLLFAKARKPLMEEGDVTITEDDILDFWSEDGYVYEEDVWQGGMVYNNLLFMLFGSTGAKAHLAVYDVRAHQRIMDISLSSAVKEEPEDCEIIPEGILVATYGGSHYYLIRPE